MGKTYRRIADGESKYNATRKPKQPGHANGRRTGGMRIINDVYEDEYIDNVSMDDDISFDLYRDAPADK